MIHDSIETKKMLNDLIEHFIYNDWKLSRTKEIDNQIHQWPEIIISNDEIATGNNFVIDTLGAYEYTKDKEIEGRVILYQKTIQRCATEFDKRFYGDNPTDEEKNKSIEAITRIVLLHEFTHWIMHWGISPGFLIDSIKIEPSGIFFGPFDISGGNKYYHESLAQIYTNFKCAESRDLWNVFIWLESQQPLEYKKYNELFLNMKLPENESLSHPIKRINKEDIQQIDNCVKICRQENEQNYNFLERINDKLQLLSLKITLKQILLFIKLGV